MSRLCFAFICLIWDFIWNVCVFIWIKFGFFRLAVNLQCVNIDTDYRYRNQRIFYGISVDILPKAKTNSQSIPRDWWLGPFLEELGSLSRPHSITWIPNHSTAEPWGRCTPSSIAWWEIAAESGLGFILFSIEFPRFYSNVDEWIFPAAHPWYNDGLIRMIFHTSISDWVKETYEVK